MMFDRLIGLLVCMGLVAGLLGCGPKEEAEPEDTATKNWIRELASLEREDIEAPVAGSGARDEAMTSLEELDRRILTLASEGPISSTAEFDGLLRELQEGVDRAALRGEPNREAAYRMGLAILYDRLGFVDPALGTLEGVFPLEEKGAQPTWGSAARSLRGALLLKKGELLAAVVAYADAVRFSGRHGEWDRARQALDQMETLCTLPEHRSAMEAAVRGGDELARYGGGQGLVEYCGYLLTRERPGSACYLALRAAEEALSDSDPVWYGIVLSRKAAWLMEEGIFVEAIEPCERSLKIQQKLGDGMGVLETALRYGIALEHRGGSGDAELATDMYRVAFHRARQFGRQYEEGAALNYLGFNLFKRRQPELSLACLLQAASVAAEVAPGTPLEENVRQNILRVRRNSSVEVSVLMNRQALLERATEL